MRFGLFRHRFPRERIVSARRVPGYWIYGIGWHTNLVNSVIVNGLQRVQPGAVVAPERVAMDARENAEAKALLANQTESNSRTANKL